MPEQEKRRHHFVPVRYLQNFTDSGGLLHVVSCRGGHRFETTPAGSGFERDLYRPDKAEDGDDPNAYENAFQQFEGDAAPVLNAIAATRQLPDSEDARTLLFTFIAFQMCRTPSMRRVIAAPREHTVRIIMDLVVSSREMWESQLRKAGYDPKDFDYEKERDAVRRGAYEPQLTTAGLIEGAMRMMETMLPYMHARTWMVITTDARKNPFVVSDHPVSSTWSDGRKSHHPPGHAHIETDLTFPVSSHVALLGRHEPLPQGVSSTPANVAAINAKTVERATTFVAACGDHFTIMECAKRILDSNAFAEMMRKS